MKQSFYTIKSIHFSLLLRVLVCFFLLTNPVRLSAQSSGKNYIVSTTPYQKVSAPADLTDANSNTSIQYFDGLGRPTQTVQRAITNSGADLAIGVEYNDYGLEYIKYLPGAVQGNNGAYVTDISNKATATNADSRPYSTTLYEASPLNRVKTEIGPGIDWSSHPKTIDYQTNDASILYFYVNGDKHLSKGSNYAAGSLFVTTVSDEDGKTAYEFKDKLGRVILKRQTCNGGNVDTYYVYNDLSQLCYVLPPKAADELTSDLSDGNPIIKQYCYLYQYDLRGNCIYKRLPGCEPIFMVYDRTDRLILSQDGNQRAKSPAQWTVSKYDQLGRVIFTGLTNSITASQTDLINSYKKDLIVETFNSGAYTNNKFSDATPLTINYYDTYSFISNGTLNYDSSQEQNGYTPQHSTAQGLLTGTRVYHLNNTSLYETTALYYDKYGRVVQSRATNHLGGYDLVYNELKFTGAPARTYKTHGINGASTTITELYTYDYNKAQQPTTTTYSLNGGGAITLVANGYDELGRLTNKKRHTNADTESYAYNVRNWVTNITSGGFTENLYYNANPLNSNATYNGNISYSTWTYNGATKGYLYDYDGLNRLLSSNFKQVSSGLGDGSFDEAFTYDKMGNIITLQRKKNNVLIDDLTLHYKNGEKSNQLEWVYDSKLPLGLNLVKEYQNNSTATSNEFVYDANGNMTKDLDRDIYTIKYNVLNLPEIVQFKNGNQIKNTYNAGGQKLGTEYFTWLPLANAPVINIGDVLNIGYSQGAIDQSGTAYIGNVEYNTKNGNSSLTVISRIHNMEGYVENISSPNYYYYRKDHLGNNREVWLANTNTTKQWTQYYPSGLPWVTTSNDNLSTQPYKYGDKEFVEMHGLDEYDSQARWFYPAIVRTPTLDPHCENYFDISPYAWCGNNPVNGIDPNGMDVWTTSDPAAIREVFNAYANGTDVTYNDKTWYYQSDKEARRKKDKDEGYSLGLNYNGETGHYFLGTSYFYGISLADLGKGPKLMSDPNSHYGIDGCYNTYTPNETKSALNTYLSIAGGELGGAALGAAISRIGGAILGRIAAKGSTQAVEGIYEFTAASGKTYVGQSGNIAARLEQHIASGKLLPGVSVRTTEILGGKTAREIGEQMRINSLGGIYQNGIKVLENVRNPIGPARQYLLP